MFYYGGIAAVAKHELVQLDQLSRMIIRSCSRLRPDHQVVELTRPVWPNGVLPAAVLSAAAIIHLNTRIMKRASGSPDTGSSVCVAEGGRRVV